MRIAVYGTGGVGGYFGGRLAQAGEEVIFIARGEHLKTMQTDGLRVDSIKGDFLVKPVQAASDPRQVGVVEIVILTVKAWQVPESAQAMLPMIGDVAGEETGVVYLGNGVDAVAQLSAVLGERHVLGGRCNISSFIAGLGHISHVGIDPRVAFGELDGRLSPRVERLRQAFVKANVAVDVPPDIIAAIWEKFVFIAAVSGVGAITRAPVGAFRSLPETRLMLEQAIDETVRVARAKKINLPEDIAANTMAFIDKMAPGVVASLARDVVAGCPSELGAQNGAVRRMGLELGIPTPVHSFIYDSLLPQELKARGEIQF
jgi:2-dehydropantoate 2-reductase